MSKLLRTPDRMTKSLRKPAKPISPSSPCDTGELKDAGTSAMQPGLIQALDKIPDILS